MKHLTIYTLLAIFCFIGTQAFSQDYSGTYLKTADTKLDNVWGDQYPATIQLYKVAENTYRSKATKEGDVVEIAIYTNGKKPVWIATNFRIGKSYFSCVSGTISGNTFKGVFTDSNGSMGNAKYVKQ